MTKVKLISSITCVKCHFIKGPLQSRAEKNGYEFEEKDISQATETEIGDSTSLPIIWLGDEKLTYDEALAMVSNNNG